MSSELSGRYRLELEQKQIIENDCRAALKACQDQRAGEKAQWQQRDAAWDQKAETASGQAAAGKAVAERAVGEKVREQRRRLEVLKERCRMLDGADEIRVQLQLAETLLTDSQGCDFAQARLDWLEGEIPRVEAAAAAARRASEAAAQPRRAAVRQPGVENARQEFVPLSFAAQQAAPQQQDPWARFCARVQNVLEQAGENALPEMKALAQRVQDTAVPRRNERMLQERELLARLEKQAEGMAKMRQNSIEEQGEQQQYRFLCQKLGLAAQPLRGGMLREENKRLFARWCAQEEENYIQQCLQEAFAQAGIPFTAPEGPVSATAELSDNMRIEMERDALGMFSMEVYGVADTEQQASEQKEQMVAQCRHFCRQFPQIVEALRKKGILLEDVGQIEPNRTTLHVRARSSRRRTAAAEREQEAGRF